MSVEVLKVGQLATNCYLFYDQKTKACFIIDPGDDSGFIKNKIKDLDLKPKAILLTHGHFDHTLAVTDLKLIYKIPFYLNKKDLNILKRQVKTAEYFTGIKTDPALMPDKYLKDKQILKLGGLDLRIIATPGHTPGGVSFYSKKEKLIFVGDLIFKDGGYGRTDLQGGNKNQLIQSIKKILFLPPDTIIYSGHGEQTTAKEEIKFLTKGGLV